MISFKGTHYPKSVILYAVFFYVRYGVSYRDLEGFCRKFSLRLKTVLFGHSYSASAANCLNAEVPC